MKDLWRCALLCIMLSRLLGTFSWHNENIEHLSYSLTDLLFIYTFCSFLFCGLTTHRTRCKPHRNSEIRNRLMGHTRKGSNSSERVPSGHPAEARMVTVRGFVVPTRQFGKLDPSKDVGREERCRDKNFKRHSGCLIHCAY